MWIQWQLVTDDAVFTLHHHYERMALLAAKYLTLRPTKSELYPTNSSQQTNMCTNNGQCTAHRHHYPVQSATHINSNSHSQVNKHGSSSRPTDRTTDRQQRFCLTWLDKSGKVKVPGCDILGYSNVCNARDDEWRSTWSAVSMTVTECMAKWAMMNSPTYGPLTHPQAL